MKKYILGLSALALAVGFSSFTGHSKKSGTTYYISLTSAVLAGHAIPANKLDFTSATTTDPSLCSQSTYFCVGKFDDSQLTISGGNVTGLQVDPAIPQDGGEFTNTSF